MDTGLKYEGEEARRRFIVYWLRPGLAALGFGLFTFVVVAVPGEKEKIKLRDEAQRLRIEGDVLQARLREMVPFVHAGRAPGLTLLDLDGSEDAAGWGRVLLDGESGRGVIVVDKLRVDGERPFCWWLDTNGNRSPIAEIEIENGAGHASIQLGPLRKGRLVVTLEPATGDPAGDGPVLFEAAFD